MKIKGGKRQEVYTYDAQKPLISIVIVTFNAAAVLQNAFDSISRQSFKNIELLVFDGASKDGTIDIIRRNETLISYWQSEPDKGIYNAMNKALEFITGQWVLFIGADDLLLEGFSEAAEKLQDVNTLYYGFCMIGNKQTNVALSDYEIAKVNICHHAVFYPAVVFKKYSYHAPYIVYADHALNIQCWGDKKIIKKYLPYAIAKYDPHGFSSIANDTTFKKEKLFWVKKNMSRYVYIRYLFRKWKAEKKGKDNFF